MNVTLHIDRLVLDGLSLDPAQARQVRAAVEAELARLFAERGVGAGLKEGGAYPLVQGSAIPLTPGGTPVEMGTQIAQSIFSGMGSPR